MSPPVPEILPETKKSLPPPKALSALSVMGPLYPPPAAPPWLQIAPFPVVVPLSTSGLGTVTLLNCVTLDPAASITVGPEPGVPATPPQPAPFVSQPSVELLMTLMAARLFTVLAASPR